MGAGILAKEYDNEVTETRNMQKMELVNERCPETIDKLRFKQSTVVITLQKEQKPFEENVLSQ